MEATIFYDIGHAFDTFIIKEGKLTLLITLLSFLLTFGFIRTSAHMIKAQVSWWPGNIETKGGLHIHHMVWGICLMIIVGFVTIGFYPHSPGREVMGFFFGIGMGLTLDEFALWLNLDDVYWSDKGRQSIDAVIVAATLFGLMLLGYKFWADIGQIFLQGLTGIGDVSKEKSLNRTILEVLQFFGLLLAIVCFFKKKYMTAAVGLFIPLVALIGSVRVAKPHSRWAKKYYGKEKIEKAEKRFPPDPKTKIKKLEEKV